MLSRAEQAPVRAELVLIAIGAVDGNDTERESLEPNFEALEASVRRRVNGILSGWEAAQKRAAERRAAAERLVFPYRETRPGQELTLAPVETAVPNRDHLLLQAATAIGK